MQSMNLVSAESSSDRASSSSVSGESWITCFINQPGNEFLAKVPKDFISEQNNLVNLNTAVEQYEDCITTLLELDTEHMDQTVYNPPFYRNMVRLYGLIHVRYINSADGIQQMAARYRFGEFGACPRVFCKNQSVLPIGLSEEFGDSFVKIFCPRCSDIYDPANILTNLDGAFFGTSFPNLFFMTLPILRPLPPTESYTPSLYGFKIAKSAHHSLPEPSIPHDKENINPNQMLLEDENPSGKDGLQ